MVSQHRKVATQQQATLLIQRGFDALRKKTGGSNGRNREYQGKNQHIQCT